MFGNQSLDMINNKRKSLDIVIKDRY